MKTLTLPLRKWLLLVLLTLVIIGGAWFALRMPPGLAPAPPVEPPTPTAHTATPLPRQPTSPLPSIDKTLRIDATNPASGTRDVSVDTPINIGFNRPVVILTDNVDQARLPQPVRLEPAVAGKGTWLDANNFQFQPVKPLAGNTTYRVLVAPFVGLEARAFTQTHTFTFTTALPAVTNSEPSGMLVRPRPIVKVQFDQAMDRASTLAAFALQELSTKRLISGDFAWSNATRTLRFLPKERLHFGEIYLINIDASAMPASRRGTLRQAYRSQFSTQPLPYVESVFPRPGDTKIDVDNQVTVRFSTFMNAASLLSHLQIEPVITNTKVYSSYSSAERTLTLNWSKEPATVYTVTLGAAITDEFGNRLGDTLQNGVPISPTGTSKALHWQFTTGDLTAFARLDLGRLTHFGVYTDTHVGLYYRNITQSQVTLYRVPLSEFARLSNQELAGGFPGYQAPDPLENLLWTRHYDLHTQRNTIYMQAIKLTDEKGKRLPPGVYLLEARTGNENAQNTPIPPMQGLLVLSNGNLVVKKATQGQSLAWLTDFPTGRPLAGRPLNFLINGFLQSTVATNGNGIAQAELQINPQRPNLPVLAVVGEPGDRDFAVGSTDWNQGITASDFKLPYRNYDEKYMLHFFTDRPLYRPGQRVYWKGIIRRWRGEAYQLPADDATLLVQLRNSQGTVIAEAKPPINEFGTVDGFFELGDEALTGAYVLNVTLTYGAGYTMNGGADFLVAAYRKSEFDIQVQSEHAEVIQGDPIRITTEATYFSGGPLTQATVHWRLVAAPHTFGWQPPDGARAYTFAPFDPQQFNTDAYAPFTGGLIKEGDGALDADGHFVLTLPADLANSFFSQRWTIDVTVQSNTNQFVNRAVSVLVHRAAYYVGISPQSYVLQQGEATRIDLITRQPNGAIYPSAPLTVTLEEYRWNNVYERQDDGNYLWKNSVERRQVLTTKVQTDQTGLAQLPWTPSKAGQYLLTVQSQDRQGNPTSSVQMLWVSTPAIASSDAYVAWPQQNHDRLALVADKMLYRPGDTAHILVPSPWVGKAKALVTVERGGVLEAHTIELASNSATVDVPILENYVPSAYISIVLLHAADETDPIPAMRLGYLQLKVDSRAKALQIAVDASATRVHPGETVQYTLTVQHATGASAPNTEVTVALVDSSVLALREVATPSLLDLFYYERGLGVTTGATMIINRDRLSQQIGSGQKGGGGGGGGLALREKFPDLAWWHAHYVTDAQGRITFQVKLPDNLTRWVLLVKALDQATYVGEARHEIVATKDLQVRPLTPRFLTAGDQATLGGVMVNTTAYTFTTEFSVTLAGATLPEGQQHFTTTLTPAAQKRITFPIAVDLQAEQVVLTMTATARAGNLPKAFNDGVRLVIPVQRFITPATVASAGLVPTLTVQLPLTLPHTVGLDAELRVKLEGSLAASMVDGLSYLEHYPYECNEQTTSRFLPNLFTVRAFRSLGLTDAVMERQLQYQLAVGVQRLLSRQNSDGGWGYWPGNPSAPFTTAYVLWGLHQAQQFGYPVSAEVLQRGGGFLGQRYISAASAQSWELNESAFTHFVLAELGQGDPGRMSVLYDNRERLGLYGKAYLVIAMAMQNTPNGSFVIAVDTLLNDILKAAQYNGDSITWHEPNQDYWSMNTDVRTSAVIVTTLLRLWPTNPLLPGAVRGLMRARQAGYWGNTQETAWSLIALTDWLRVTHELEGNYQWQVRLDGKALADGVVDKATRSQSVEVRSPLLGSVPDRPQRLTISRNNTSGQLYYSTWVRYTMDALAVQPLNQGIILDRRIEQAAHATGPIHVGDLITVTLYLTATTELHHMLLEAPLPAGSEVLDDRLATEASNQNNAPAAKLIGLGANGTIIEYQRLWPNYVDLRDDKVAFFATYLPVGHYFVRFPVRATLPGIYRVLPAHAEMMYFPDVMGHSAGDRVVITEPNFPRK